MRSSKSSKKGTCLTCGGEGSWTHFSGPFGGGGGGFFCPNRNEGWHRRLYWLIDSIQQTTRAVPTDAKKSVQRETKKKIRAFEEEYDAIIKKHMGGQSPPPIKHERP